MLTISHDDERIALLSRVVRRFLRYVRIDTQSDPGSQATPSTERQKSLGRLLAAELATMGLHGAGMDESGYVFGVLQGVGPAADVRLGLLAHLDTSSDEPGEVSPLVHLSYDGRALPLPGSSSVRLDPSERPELLDHVGEDLITGDGTSLLGSDDKAGVAVLMQLAEDLAADDSSPRPELRFCFTVDEEIGRGVDKLDLERFGAQVAYTIDGGGTDTIYAETFNAAEVVLSIDGVMVHPGYAEGVMVNAARILAQCLARLPDDEAPETTSGRDGYIHPCRIYASDASHARARLILRDFTERGLRQRKDLVTSVVDAARRAHPRATISVEIRDQYKNMRTYIRDTDPRVVSFAHAAAASMGIELRERLVRGGTDGARLSEMGIPTPNIFNGGHDFHSRFEWNTAQSIERSLDYVKALVRYWGEYGHESGRKS